MNNHELPTPSDDAEDSLASLVAINIQRDEADHQAAEARRIQLQLPEAVVKLATLAAAVEFDNEVPGYLSPEGREKISGEVPGLRAVAEAQFEAFIAAKTAEGVAQLRIDHLQNKVIIDASTD